MELKYKVNAVKYLMFSGISFYYALEIPTVHFALGMKHYRVYAYLPGGYLSVRSEGEVGLERGVY